MSHRVETVQPEPAVWPTSSKNYRCSNWCLPRTRTRARDLRERFVLRLLLAYGAGGGGNGGTQASVPVLQFGKTIKIEV
jgi:hypothetical protein